MTWFSFVRDPLERLVAAFFEIQRDAFGRDACADAVDPPSIDIDGPGRGQGFCAAGVNPHTVLRLGGAFDRADVLARFEAMVTALEIGEFRNLHTEPQAPRLLLTEAGSVDFIGHFGNFEEGWRELGEMQAVMFGVSWPQLPMKQRPTHSTLLNLLNVSSLPRGVTRRICRLYREDYCCLGLRIPLRCGWLKCE